MCVTGGLISTFMYNPVSWLNRLTRLISLVYRFNWRGTVHLLIPAIFVVLLVVPG